MISQKDSLFLPLTFFLSIILILYSFSLSDKHIYCSLLISLYLVLYIGIIKSYRYYNNVTGFFVAFLTFVRYCIIPTLIFVDDEYLNYSPFESSENRVYFINGVLFTIWEALFFGIFIMKAFPKWYRYSTRVTTTHFRRESSSILVAEMLLMAIVVLLYPSVLENYSYMFNLDSDEEIVEQLSPSLIENLAIMGTRVLKILMPMPFVLYFYRRYQKHKRTKYFVMSALFFVFFYALIMEGNSRNSIIIPAISIIFILNALYPRYQKSVWSSMIVIIAVISVLSIIFKVFSNDVSAMVEASQLSYWVWYLEAYFAGISNMGKAVAAKLSYGLGVSPAILFNDFFQNVPFFSLLTDPSNNTHSYYFAIWGRSDQIVPSSGNGLFYFGFVLAPLVPVLIASLGHLFEKKSRETTFLSEYIVYTFASATICYNIFNQVSSLMMKISITIFPVLLAVYVNKIARRKNKINNN